MQAIHDIAQGWKMAEVNPDGSRASAPRRAYNFMSNGGGAITSRMVVVAMLPILAGMIGLMWNDLRAGQLDVQKSVIEQGKSIVGNTTMIDAMRTGQQRIWMKLGAHDALIDDARNRVTRLEACQPNCAPR